ncbi:MAG: hypothetical protein HZC28_08500 [Spirochaetes bacterium]|nr:hypothetical protein [Spirochaetota bacterium]
MKLSHYILMILAAMAVTVFAAPTPGAKAEKKMRVGVIDFTAKGMAQNEALVISEMFRTSLVNTEMFDVIDRNNMGTIMKEQEFQQTNSQGT